MRTHLKYYLENESERVKNAVFHPSSTLLMCSLHNGDIQIWDYRTKVMLNNYQNAHNGSVRGLCFHPNRPLVVSGGDDCVIRMWNYRDTKSDNACVGEFRGHTDYIRSTYFHPTRPWILSCSDDRIIRIWNYLSLKCIAIMTGHDHYVLSAHFHPDPNIPLVISSSFDTTVRVWDIRDLYESEPRGDGAVDLAGCTKFNLTPDQFAVNYAIFHPKMQAIFTCGDDKTVKMWRYNDSSCWHESTFRGHTHNVTGCTVMGDYLVSVGEDKCVNVFNIKTQKLIRSFRTDGRIWSIEKHPLENMFAIGCDTGLKLFKLESERPAFFVTGRNVYYQTEASINKFDLSTNKSVLLYTVPRCRSLVAIPQAKEMVIMANGDSHSSFCGAFQRTGLPGSSVCYVGGNSYLSYEPQSNHVSIVDAIKSKEVGQIELEKPGNSISAVNRKNTFCVFGNDCTQIVDIEGKVVFNVDVSGLKRAVATTETLVLYGAQSIVLIKDINGSYDVAARMTETTIVKSVVVTGKGVVLYTTNAHIKYMLTSGEVGIVQGTGNSVLYLVAASTDGQQIVTIDRNGELEKKTVNLADVDFKAAVLKRDLAAVRRHLEETVFIGDAIISFLLKYNYAELALLFVRDINAKFEIAIQCGNLKAALEAAKELKLPKYWRQLAQRSLQCGEVRIAEYALVQLGDFSKVSYLSAYSGNIHSMQRLTQLEAPHSQKLILSLLGGDTKTIVKECYAANEKLGYIAAKRMGYNEIAERMAGEMKVTDKLNEYIAKEHTPIPFGEVAVPIAYKKSWPTVGDHRSIEQDLSEAKEINDVERQQVFDGIQADQLVVEKPKKANKKGKKQPKKPVQEDDDDNWDFV